MDRNQKIELLKAIHKGQKSIHELANVINVEIWEDEGRPGYYRETISGRVASLDQLRKEYANTRKKGVSIFWCDFEIQSKITN